MQSRNGEYSEKITPHKFIQLTVRYLASALLITTE